MKRKRVSERAVNFILSRQNKELSHLKVGDIARIIGVNRSYLSRSFKLDQDISLSDFISREKIYRAIFILDKDHKKPIDELAEELGFIRVEDFVREFVKQLAIDPERYKHLRKKQKILHGEMELV